MEYGCPVCNGMASIAERCPRCGAPMTDAGMVEDFYGPYSPYENMDLYELPCYWQLADDAPCVHLYACPACGYDKRVAFPQVTLK